MRRAGGAAALIAAAPALATAVPPSGLARAGEKEDLEALRKRVERLRGDLAGAEGSRSEAADQLRESERAISEASRTLRDLAAELALARGGLRDIEAETARVAAARAAREGELATLLRARYVAASPGALASILSGDAPNRIARELVYVG